MTMSDDTKSVIEFFCVLLGSVLLFLTLGTTKTIDEKEYCTIQCCNETIDICVPTEGCSLVDLTIVEKREIIYTHNVFRNMVATGNMTIRNNAFPSASRMLYIRYDWDLEDIAEKAALRCNMTIACPDNCSKDSPRAIPGITYFVINERGVSRETSETKEEGMIDQSSKTGGATEATAASNKKKKRSNGENETGEQPRKSQEKHDDQEDDYSVGKIVTAWFNEINKFDPKTVENNAQESLTNFTQLIWGETSRIGCAKATPGNDTFYIVCAYYPRATLENKTVYPVGDVCSSCPEKCSPLFPGLCGAPIHAKIIISGGDRLTSELFMFVSLYLVFIID